MDIVTLKRKYGRQLTFLGNIDVDMLARGTTEEVTRLVRERIAALAVGGGYMLGSSNSVCDYVKPENYYAMLRTNWEYGKRN